MLSLAGFVSAGACLDDDDDEPSFPPDGAAEPTVVTEVGLELVADGFTSPVLLREAPDDSGRLFIVDQVGLISIVNADGRLLDEPFLDLRGSLVELMEDFDERGLLGLAFHPDFDDNGRFFVYYSAPLREGGPEGWDHTARVSEFTAAANADRADLASERIVLEVDQPQFNPAGGTVAFGPEGMLYISLGDGGEANDVGVGHPPLGNGQDTSTLLGSILRIDVDGGDPYAIPADNPFVGRGGRDEIFAYGFRNPYRMSFDIGGNRSLFASDAGQDLWEEIDIVVRGGNYGWNIREGTHCFDPDNPDTSPVSCATEGAAGEPLIDPILEYKNANAPDGLGLAAIGGFVYRGTAIGDLAGEYIFGDYTASFDEPAGILFAATPPPSPEVRWSLRQLAIAGRTEGALGEFVRGFGQDARGEIYVLAADEVGPTGSTGRVYRIVRSQDADDTATGGS